MFKSTLRPQQVRAYPVRMAYAVLYAHANHQHISGQDHSGHIFSEVLYEFRQLLERIPMHSDQIPSCI